MQLTVNGDSVDVASPALSDALELLGFESKKVVVAVNETFVARDKWDSYELSPGDRLDVLGRIEGG